jgi:UDP-N-acetylmuramoyl-tripeptide--D-alanyl-D-alanine ligase
MKMKLSEAAKYLNGELVGQDAEFQAISSDTRTLNPGDLFVAWKGDNFDGHDYVAAALEKGAVAALVDRKVSADLPQVVVASVPKALAQLAAYHREQLKRIPLIALTGSCGKTTTKEMLRSILLECGPTLANKNSFNNEIGGPSTLLQLTDQHRYAVIEMGANHPGEIAHLTNMAKPNVAFINNIAPAHLEGFGSVEGVARAKSEIFQGLSEEGVAVINADDNFSEQIKNLIVDKKLKNVFTFGIKSKADFFATNITIDAEQHCSFILHTPKGEVTISLAVLGQHNVMNALAAAAAASAVGADLSAIKTGLEKTQAVYGRLVTKQGHNGARIFDDTYNANPFSIKAALEVLAKHPGEKIFVMGEMRELGTDAEKLHQEIGECAKQLGVDRLYACGNLTQATVKGFGDGAQYFAEQKQLSDAVRAMLQPQVAVLVKGSRVMKMENVVAELLCDVMPAKAGIQK